jgi:hypothetical protein
MFAKILSTDPNNLLSVHEKEELLAGLEPEALLEHSYQLHHVHVHGDQPLHLHTKLLVTHSFFNFSVVFQKSSFSDP